MLETERLVLREFNLEDADFIFELLTTDAWLKNIGDKNIHSLEDAENYIKTGPLDSYRKHGYGAWLVALKGCNTPIGICGYFKRDYLDSADIGYALLPDHWGKGYAYEAAMACKTLARNKFGMNTIYGICSPSNQASIKLLEKVGLEFVEHREEDGETLAVYKLDLV